MRSSSLRDLADDARCCSQALDCLNATSEMNNKGNLRQIMDKMPKYTQDKWRARAHKI